MSIKPSKTQSRKNSLEQAAVGGALVGGGSGGSFLLDRRLERSGRKGVMRSIARSARGKPTGFNPGVHLPHAAGKGVVRAAQGVGLPLAAWGVKNAVTGAPTRKISLDEDVAAPIVRRATYADAAQKGAKEMGVTKAEMTASQQRKARAAAREAQMAAHAAAQAPKPAPLPEIKTVAGTLARAPMPNRYLAGGLIAGAGGYGAYKLGQKVGKADKRDSATVGGAAVLGGGAAGGLYARGGYKIARAHAARQKLTKPEQAVVDAHRKEVGIKPGHQGFLAADHATRDRFFQTYPENVHGGGVKRLLARTHGSTALGRNFVPVAAVGGAVTAGGALGYLNGRKKVTKSLMPSEQERLDAHRKVGRATSLVGGTLGLTALGLRAPGGARALVNRGAKSGRLIRLAGHADRTTAASNTTGIAAIGTGSAGSFNYAAQQKLERKRDVTKAVSREDKEKIGAGAAGGAALAAAAPTLQPMPHDGGASDRIARQMGNSDSGHVALSDIRGVARGKGHRFGDSTHVARIAVNMHEHGFDPKRPIEVTRFGNGQMMVTGGHHRLEAAERLGHTHAPVRVLHSPSHSPRSAVPLASAPGYVRNVVAYRGQPQHKQSLAAIKRDAAKPIPKVLERANTVQSKVEEAIQHAKSPKAMAGLGAVGGATVAGGLALRSHRQKVAKRGEKVAARYTVAVDDLGRRIETRKKGGRLVKVVGRAVREMATDPAPTVGLVTGVPVYKATYFHAPAPLEQSSGREQRRKTELGHQGWRAGAAGLAGASTAAIGARWVGNEHAPAVMRAAHVKAVAQGFPKEAADRHLAQGLKLHRFAKPRRGRLALASAGLTGAAAGAGAVANWRKDEVTGLSQDLGRASGGREYRATRERLSKALPLALAVEGAGRAARVAADMTPHQRRIATRGTLAALGSAGALGAAATGTVYGRRYRKERAQLVRKTIDPFLRHYRDRISPDAERGYKDLRYARTRQLAGAGSAGAMAGLSGWLLKHEASQKVKSKPALAVTAASTVGSALGAVDALHNAGQLKGRQNKIKNKAYERERAGLYGPDRGKTPVDMTSTRARHLAKAMGVPR